MIKQYTAAVLVFIFYHQNVLTSITILETREKSVFKNIFRLYFMGFSSINEKILPINENIFRRKSVEIEICLNAVKICIATLN